MTDIYTPIEGLARTGIVPKYALFCQRRNSTRPNPLVDLLISRKFTQEEINDTFAEKKESFRLMSERLGGTCTMWKRLYIAILTVENK